MKTFLQHFNSDSHLYIEFKFIDVRDKDGYIIQLSFDDGKGYKHLGLISLTVFDFQAKAVQKNFVFRFTLHNSLVKKLHALVSIDECKFFGIDEANRFLVKINYSSENLKDMRQDLVRNNDVASCFAVFRFENTFNEF